MAEDQNLESIRKTMEMHEEIFKHQVRELHRLYRVQKMLMNELRSETRQNKGSSSTSVSDVNGIQIVGQDNPVTETRLHIQVLTDNPTSRERSGSCSGDMSRVPRGFDLKRTAEEDALMGVMAPKCSKMRIGSCDGDSEVELTLSIGGTSSSSCSSKKSKDFLAHRSLRLGGFESTTSKELRELHSSASFSIPIEKKIAAPQQLQ